MVKRHPDFHKGHRDRMRKQIHEEGLEVLNEIQILESFLYNPVSRADTNELAHVISNETGGLFAQAVTTDYEQLIKIKGVGPRIAYEFDYFRQLAKHYYTSLSIMEYNQEEHSNSNDLCNVFQNAMLGVKNEEFHVIGFDDNMHIIYEKVISIGDPSSVALSLRKLNELVIYKGFSKIAVGHNHPNGRFTPSIEDIEYTKKLVRHFAEINVEVVDHIIVGKGGALSMRSSIYSNGIWD